MSDNTTDASPRWTSHDIATFVVDIVGIIGIIAAIYFSNQSLGASTQALDLTTQQLSEAKYESVYGHQLDLWHLAADKPEVAAYIIGGKKPHDGNPDEQTLLQRKAAVINSLDFYAYVFAQLAPRDDAGNMPPDILTTEIQPNYVNDKDEWKAWHTWGITIAGGFDLAPGMCDLLNNNDAYEQKFRDAVKFARQDSCVTG